MGKEKAREKEQKESEEAEMTERERLKELLLDAADEAQYMCIEDMDANSVADYLLSNGVIVPPCKVGDTLYLPISHRVIAYEVSTIKFDGSILRIVTRNKLSNIQRTIWSQDVGETIFLTKEEAEKALKEREDK